MIDYNYLNDGTLIEHFSTLGVELLQVETGETYDRPVDIVPCPYTYIETDIPIKVETDINVDKK